MEKDPKKLKDQILKNIGYRVSTVELTKIVTDWQKEFPGLQRYKTTQKIFKRLGPILIGIDLEKYLSSKYRPRFIAINLLDNNADSLVPFIDQTIKDDKGNDFSILYRNHETEYMMISEILKKQAYINLNKTLTLEEVLKGIMDGVKNYTGIQPFRACKAILQFSILLKNVKVRQEYFNFSVMTLKKKFTPELLNKNVGNYNHWINGITNVSNAEAESAIENSLNKYQLQNMPHFAIEY